MSVDRSLLSIILGVFALLAVCGFLPGVAGGIIATVIGSAATIGGIKDVNDWWRLVNTDPVPIRESVATDAVVQIQGTVRPPQSSDTVVSPIRGEECVAYEYNINHQVQGTGDPSIDSGVEYNPFIISDGTAEIYIDPTEESLSLQQETTTVMGVRKCWNGWMKRDLI